MQIIKSYIKKAEWLRFCISILLYLYLRLIYSTMKDKMLNEGEGLDRAIGEGKIILLWHNQLALGPYFLARLKNAYALASPHADGKIIGYIVQLMGHKVLWGSSNRDGTKALRQIYKLLKSGANIVITPDGPRGPSEEFNSNIAELAKIARVDIILVGCALDKATRLKSWDKMLVPKMFAKVTYMYETITYETLKEGNIGKDELAERLSKLTMNCQEHAA